MLGARLPRPITEPCPAAQNPSLKPSAEAIVLMPRSVAGPIMRPGRRPHHRRHKTFGIFSTRKPPCEGEGTCVGNRQKGRRIFFDKVRILDNFPQRQEPMKVRL